MRGSITSLIVVLTLGAGACECDDGTGGTRRRTDAAIPAEIDAPIDPGQDAPFPDVFAHDAPVMDSGCEATTPIMNEIVGDPPDMLIVMDVSGSMCSPLVDTFPPTMTTKMQIMKASLTSLVTTWDRRINFGMMLFPQGSECGAGAVTNPIMMRNASAISGRLAGIRDDFFGCALANAGATPTHLSIDAARAYFATIPVNPVGRYALLATDGLPNCGPALPDGGTEETVDETVTAIEGLAADGIRTYVLGFGSGLDGGGAALMRMATAGMTSRPFNARSATELDRALEMIAAEIIPPSCTVMLDGAARDPGLFQVSFDGGSLIPRDESHTRGWDYDAATNTITFYGSDCDRLQSGEVVDVDIDFGCPGPLI